MGESDITPENLIALQYWYGTNKANQAKYVEAYEFAEFGRQMTKEDVEALFPMLSIE